MTPRTPAKIEILSDKNAGHELALVGEIATVGRPGHQVAASTRRLSDFFIEHVEGEIFPVVNGQNLGSNAHPLNHGDVIEVAGATMEFCNPGEQPSAEPEARPLPTRPLRFSGSGYAEAPPAQR